MTLAASTAAPRMAGDDYEYSDRPSQKCRCACFCSSYTTISLCTLCARGFHDPHGASALEKLRMEARAKFIFSPEGQQRVKAISGGRSRSGR